VAWRTSSGGVTALTSRSTRTLSVRECSSSRMIHAGPCEPLRDHRLTTVSSSIAAKCSSEVARGNPRSMQSAAIQRSFSGMGLPFRFSSIRIRA
jgi:hypothetical protein